MEYSKTKLTALVILRLLIGWHFFYEGMIKLLNPAWTSKAYLLDSGGTARPFFEWIAGNPALLSANNLINAWVLTLAGGLLLLGWLTKPAAIAGMGLMALYYLSHPPFPDIVYIFPSDGNYFIVNKTLIEMAALGVIFSFPTAHIFGLERIIKKLQNKNSDGSGK
jgi:thiosulfate dehydrogenase (quinone) large subunit